MFEPVREAAARNIHLTDESILIDLVKNDSNRFVRLFALKNPNLKDEAFLADIACNHEDSAFRMDAVQNPNFQNEELLKHLAENDSGVLVRIFAEHMLRKLGKEEEIIL